MKSSYVAGSLYLALILLSGCGTQVPGREPMQENGSEMQEEQSFDVSFETMPEGGEESKFVVKYENPGIQQMELPGNMTDDFGIEETSEPAGTAYEAFLAGSILRFDSEDIKTWRLDDWKDTFLSAGELEYVYLDLDGDGVEELLVQHIDSPEAYNGVFHYENGKLYCWQHDGMEGSCRDYPLRDGTMVRQYDYGGACSYTLFRYRADGSEEKLSNLFVREELTDPDSTDPCPYYEVGGMEVDKDTFEEQLNKLVTSQMLERWAWTAL